MQETQETTQALRPLERSLWITDGIIIALITALAYFWTFSFHIGANIHFNIPYQLISLDLSLVLGTMFVYIHLVTILALMLLGFMLLNRLPRTYHPSLVIAECVVIIVYLTWTQQFIGASAFAVLLLIVVFIVPIRKKRLGEGNYRSRLKSFVFPPSQDTEYIPYSFQLHPQLMNISIMFLTFLLVFVVSNGSWKLGYDSAKEQEIFQVIYENPENKIPKYVVLQIYGEYVITSPLVPTVKESGEYQIERELFILKLSEMSQTPLVYKNVGPLNLKEEVRALDADT